MGNCTSLKYKHTLIMISTQRQLIERKEELLKLLEIDQSKRVYEFDPKKIRSDHWFISLENKCEAFTTDMNNYNKGPVNKAKLNVDPTCYCEVQQNIDKVEKLCESLLYWINYARKSITEAKEHAKTTGNIFKPVKEEKKKELITKYVEPIKFESKYDYDYKVTKSGYHPDWEPGSGYKWEKQEEERKMERWKEEQRAEDKKKEKKQEEKDRSWERKKKSDYPHGFSYGNNDYYQTEKDARRDHENKGCFIF